MTPERWRQVTSVFHSAAGISDALVREDYLRDACGGDSTLREDVDSLLAALPEPGAAPEPDLRDTTSGTGHRLDVGAELGPYQIQSLLGAGGMGEVYRALDTRLDRTVAIKLLPKRFTSSPHQLLRFKREARAIAGLSHPHICTLYDVGRQDDVDYLVMELVDGETLATRLTRGRLPVDEAIRVARAVADALAAAHAKDIIHRDIKPSNIVISATGSIKVVDFGLARPAHAEAAEAATADATEPGLLIGTPRYMAPEQATGQPLGPTADIFSLGVVLFECLAGELPFEGARRHDYLRALLADKRKSLAALRPDTPEPLQELVARCLDGDPSTRIGSAAALIDELDRLDTPGSATRQKSRTRPAAALAVGVAAVAIGLALWLVISRWPDAGGDVVAQLRRFTTTPGEEVGSRFSPDGTWVSFIAMENDERGLFAQHIDATERLRVVLPPGQLQSHVWSPDQKLYACLMRQAGGLSVQVVPAFTGRDTPLTTVALPATVRNARLIRWVGPNVYMEAQEGGSSAVLRQVNLDRGTIDVVTGRWTEQRGREFDVSEDGTQILWSAAHPETRHDALWVASRAAGTARQVTRDDDSRKRSPRWNGRGTGVVFQSNRGGQVDLWELDLKTGASIQRTSDPGIERPESTSSIGSISYALTIEKAALWLWTGRDGRGTQVTEGGLSELAPSVSKAAPIQLAFQRSLPSPVEGFLQMDTDIFGASFTREATRLEPARRLATGLAPQLSPDGQWLAYLQRGRNTPALGRLMARRMLNAEVLEISSAVPLPMVDDFPADWLSRTFAWTASNDLLFVELSTAAPAWRLKRHRPGAGTIELHATSGRLLDIAPSEEGNRAAYLVGTTTTPAAAPARYEVRVFDLLSGADRSVGEVRPAQRIHLRGWLSNRDVIVASSELFDSRDRTWTFSLLALSPDAEVRNIGKVDRVRSLSQFDQARGELFYSRATKGVENLMAYSIITGRTRQLTDNGLRDVTFGGVAPLQGDAAVGIRHELTSDIHVLDARPRPRGASRP